MAEERKTIYLCLAHMSEDKIEQKYVQEAFDTNWVVPMGPNVNAFEHDLENFVNHVQVSSEEGGMKNNSDATPHSSLNTPHSEGNSSLLTPNSSLDRHAVCLSAGTAAGFLQYSLTT